MGKIGESLGLSTSGSVATSQFRQIALSRAAELGHRIEQMDRLKATIEAMEEQCRGAIFQTRCFSASPAPRRRGSPTTCSSVPPTAAVALPCLCPHSPARACQRLQWHEQMPLTRTTQASGTEIELRHGARLCRESPNVGTQRMFPDRLRRASIRSGAHASFARVRQLAPLSRIARYRPMSAMARSQKYIYETL
uniref:hypothetical protein n=1 Tax=Variovorax sp. BK018 TaxID=3450241 RepID=UPI0040398F83